MLGRRVRPDTESKSPTHSSGVTPSVVGMADAAVGGDDARAGDLRVDARRADKIAAEKDGETAHGDGLITRPRRKWKAQSRMRRKL